MFRIRSIYVLLSHLFSFYLFIYYLVFFFCCLGGAFIDHKNNNGKTAVDIAREKGNETIINITKEHQEEQNNNELEKE